MDDEIEWTGNILTRNGATCRLGDITGEVVRCAPEVVPRSRRAWYITIIYGQSMTINDKVLATVIVTDMMPDAARRECEQLVRWAAAYHGA